MLYLYVFSLVLGGTVLAVSLFVGGHSDADAGGHGDASGHTDASSVGDTDHAGLEAFIVRLFSVRFWTFFLTFFGLTGLVLLTFDLAPAWLTGLLSAAMGLVTGIGAIWAVGLVGREDSNSSAYVADLVGKTGKILVPCGPKQAGKVRIEARGMLSDLVARSVDDKEFAAGTEVIVVEVVGTEVLVGDPRRSIV